MPRILRIVNRFNIGGPTYNAAYLTKYLPDEFETLLIGGAKDESEESSEYILHELGIGYRILPEMKRKLSLRNDWAAYQSIKKIIKEFKPDIVHTHAAKAGALGRLAASACGVKVIVHTFHGHVFHSYFGKLRTLFYKSIERYLGRKTSAIIAISEKQKEELSHLHRIAPSEKIRVIPLGFDLLRFHENQEEKRKLFRNTHGLKTDEIAIGIIGRLVPVKNHTLFLQALKYCKEHSHIKLSAFIIGDGEERNMLEAITKELGLESIVKFTSWAKHVDQVYPGLDIVCLTSFNEGTPVSLIEAQAANRPIVSTNVGGIENVVIPNRTALLLDVSETQKFCENLLKLVENEKLRMEMGSEGWNHVKEKFHYTRLCSDMASLYREKLKS